MFVAAKLYDAEALKLIWRRFALFGLLLLLLLLLLLRTTSSFNLQKRFKKKKWPARVRSQAGADLISGQVRGATVLWRANLL